MYLYYLLRNLHFSLPFFAKKKIRLIVYNLRSLRDIKRVRKKMNWPMTDFLIAVQASSVRKIKILC